MPHLDIPPTPIVQPVPLPIVDEDNGNGLAAFDGVHWIPLPDWHFGVPITEGAFINRGLLTPPPTPPKLPPEELQGQPNAPEPLLLWMDNAQADPNVLGLHDFNVGNAIDVPFNNFNDQPFDPIEIEIGGNQEPGPVGFDVDLAFHNFDVTFDGDGNEVYEKFSHEDEEDDEHADDDILIGPVFEEVVGYLDGDDTEADHAYAHP